MTALNQPVVSGSSTNDGLVDKAKKFLGDKLGSTPGQSYAPPLQMSTNPTAVASDNAQTTTPVTLANSNPQTTVNKVFGVSNLVDALLQQGKITEDQAKGLKFESVTYNRPLELLIEEKGILPAEEVQRTKAEMRGIGFVDLSAISIDQSVLQLIPQETAKQNMAIAFQDSPVGLKVAMNDPLDLQKIQFLESIVKKRIESYYASDADIMQIINTRYGAEIGKEVDEALESVSDLYDPNAAGQAVESNSQDAPVIKIVNMVLDYAAKHGASDIHIEPRENKIGVRYRINGVLGEKLTIPKELVGPVVTRIKILSNLKIDEHRVPQDGRFQFKAANKIIDMRVSVIPTVYGEKVVMRLLEKGGGVMSLEDTGLWGQSLQLFKSYLERTQGIILVTGPTGSGKTQTLASCLKILNQPGVNTMTLEDPVEIRIDGVNQVQINTEVGLTFANGLRSFLRQDPDIIMVGEIRDSETAKLAIQASLTGHLVLATLHTNSSAGALPRLIQMGVEPYLLASTINVILGQRLVRKINMDNATSQPANASQLQKLHEILDPLGSIKLQVGGQSVLFDKNTQQVNLYEPKPTVQSDTGFAGRMGVFEVLKITDPIRDLTMKSSSETEISKVAVQEGMVTMVQDGFIKALQGMTTLGEVMRVAN